MKTVNAFELVDNRILMHLTQSFRCIPEIGKFIEQYGKKFLYPDFKFTGTANMNKEIKTEAHLTRGNISLIETMHSFHKQNKHYSLTRKINDIFELPVSLHEANKGMRVTSKKYNFLESEFTKYLLDAHKNISFFNYLEIIFDADTDIKKGINLLITLDAEKVDILQVKQQAELMSDNPNIKLSTAHTFKGLEADIVYINDDLNEALEKAENNKKEFYKKNKKDAKLPASILNELNLYYVAISRAKIKIENISPLIFK